jgi:hypothetical protein
MLLIERHASWFLEQRAKFEDRDSVDRLHGSTYVISYGCYTSRQKMVNELEWILMRIASRIPVLFENHKLQRPGF